MFKLSKQLILGAGALGVITMGAATASAATDSQTNTVTVENTLAVTAPVAGSMTHDGTDTNQAFSPASWSVESNGASGASVTFEAGSPFTHATATTYKRDVKLDLALATSDSAAGWSVSTPSAQTDHGAATNTAAVSAASTAAGNASFDLTVTMLNTDASTMAAGDYATTITATLTAN